MSSLSRLGKIGGKFVVQNVDEAGNPVGEAIPLPENIRPGKIGGQIVLQEFRDGKPFGEAKPFQGWSPAGGSQTTPKPSGLNLAPVAVDPEGGLVSDPQGQFQKSEEFRKTGGERFTRNVISPALRSGAINTGAAVGTALAGPLNAIPGGGTAARLGMGAIFDQAYQGAQQLLPKWLGAPPDNMEDAVKESFSNSGKEMAGNYIFGKIGQGVSALADRTGIKGKLLEYMGKKAQKNMDPADLARIQEMQKAAPTTVGQSTQNDFYQALEDTTNPLSKKQDFHVPQQKELTAKAWTATTSQTKKQAAETATTRAASNFEIAKNVEKLAYDRLKNETKGVKGTVAWSLDPTGQTIKHEVFAPVSIPRTFQGFKEVEAGLEQQLKSADLTGPVRKDVEKLLTEVKQVTNAPHIWENGQQTNVLGMDNLRTLKNRFDDILTSEEFAPLKTRLGGLMEKGRNTLSADLNDPANLVGWSDRAKKALFDAHKASNAKYSIYEVDTAAKLAKAFRDPNMDKTEALEAAMKSVQTMEAATKAIGSRAPLRDAYIVKALREEGGLKSLDAKGKPFIDGQKLQELINSKDERMEFLFSGPDGATAKKTLQEVGRTSEMFHPELFEEGRSSVGFIGDVLSAGAAAGQGNPVSFAYRFGKLVGKIPVTEKFVKSFLMNPENAKIITGLAKVPPQSKQAENLGKLFFGALKAAQIKSQYQEAEP